MGGRYEEARARAAIERIDARASPALCELIDDRWMELFLSRLKDMAEYQEKKSKLTAGRGRREENLQQPKPEPPKKTKGKGGKKGKDKDSEAVASAES